MKTLTKLLLLALCIGYLTFVFLKVSRTQVALKCEGVRTLVADSAKAGFITPVEVDRLLQKAALYPVGREMSRISGAEIEQALRRNHFISDVHVYKTPANRMVNIVITQRAPLLRVMADSGEDFYIDEHGARMQAGRYAADVPVATGSVGLRYARGKLLALGRELRDDAFWNAQIQQICVRPDGEVDLVPRVGRQLIHFGDPSRETAVKLRNLRAFYEKVMPEVGWNKYAQINLEHTNQIICKQK